MDQTQIRVFLSSTFQDMQAERDHLVKRVFPALKRKCQERGLDFAVVDLRWGVIALYFACRFYQKASALALDEEMASIRLNISDELEREYAPMLESERKQEETWAKKRQDAEENTAPPRKEEIEQAEEAARLYEELFQTSNNSDRVREIYSTLKGLLTASPIDLYLLDFDTGDALLCAGNYQEALLYLKPHVDDPNRFVDSRLSSLTDMGRLALFECAVSYMNLGRWEEAKASYTQFLRDGYNPKESCKYARNIIEEDYMALGAILSLYADNDSIKALQLLDQDPNSDVRDLSHSSYCEKERKEELAFRCVCLRCVCLLRLGLVKDFEAKREILDYLKTLVPFNHYEYLVWHEAEKAYAATGLMDKALEAAANKKGISLHIPPGFQDFVS